MLFPDWHFIVAYFFAILFFSQQSQTNWLVESVETYISSIPFILFFLV